MSRNPLFKKYTYNLQVILINYTYNLAGTVINREQLILIHISLTSAFYWLNSLSALYVLFMVEFSVDFFVNTPTKVLKLNKSGYHANCHFWRV